MNLDHECNPVVLRRHCADLQKQLDEANELLNVVHTAVYGPPYGASNQCWVSVRVNNVQVISTRSEEEGRAITEWQWRKDAFLKKPVPEAV